MSYFATVSGVILDGERIAGLNLVPVDQAQEYVRVRAPAIAALDGAPVYFCDDTATGTSDDFIGSAQDQVASTGSLEGHPMMKLLELCEQRKAVLRIWYPNSERTDFERAISCQSVSDATKNMIAQGYAGHWYFRVAP